MRQKQTTPANSVEKAIKDIWPAAGFVDTKIGAKNGHTAVADQPAAFGQPLLEAPRPNLPFAIRQG